MILDDFESFIKFRIGTGYAGYAMKLCKKICSISLFKLWERGGSYRRNATRILETSPS